MRVFIADPSWTIRGKFIELLREIPNVQIVGEASIWGEVVAQLPELSYEVGIIDQDILKSPATQSIQHLKRIQPQARVIILSNVFTPEHEKAFKQAGADDVLDKSLDFSLLQALLTRKKD